MSRRMRFLSALSLVLVGLLLFGSGVAAAGGDSSQGKVPLEKARQVLEDRLLGTPGFAGIAHSEDSGEIVIFAENEWSKARMPAWSQGYPVRVKVSGPFRALPTLVAEPEAPEQVYGVGESRLDAVRPLVGGTSFSAYVAGEYWAGTLGMVTYDDKLLTNAHVIALDLSNDWLPKLTTPVVQPATLEGGTLPEDRVGTLENYIRINFKRQPNYADAAIAAIDDTGIEWASGWQFSESGDYQISGTTTVEVGDEVRKSGRTTGVTTGEVYLTNATVQVDYGYGHRAYFMDQVIVSGDFIQAGDSGSAVDKGGQFVGLAFAGSPGYAIVCKASYIEEGLGVSFAPVTPPTLESIAVTPKTASIAVGDTQQFVATGTYSDTSTSNLTSEVTWSSSNDSFASVDDAGVATGVGVGSATITATLGSLTNSAILTVTEDVSLPALAVSVTTDHLSYKVGETVTITVAVADDITPVVGAAVHVEVTNGRGAVRFIDDGTTVADGSASFSYTIAVRDGAGTYTVSASASMSGYESGTDSTTFDVSKK